MEETKKTVSKRYFHIVVYLKDKQIVSIKDINEEPITEEECKTVFNVLVNNGYINIFDEVSQIRIFGQGDGTEDYVDIWLMDEDGELLESDEVNLNPSLHTDELLQLM